jgi:AmmeMemoRadiSam system protein B
MQTVRPPAVAGSFYPKLPQECLAQVDHFLHGRPVIGAAPKVLLVPHAGYVYSGDVAGRAYAQLIPLRNKIKRVVLLGPNHRVPLRGIALPSVDYFESPLGLVPLDKASINALCALPFVGVSDPVHAQEHSLEVHLPFLQRVLASFVLVPLVVGEVPPEQVAQALDLVWGGDETLIVLSTDLSHYLPYDQAVQTDLNTQAAILQLRTDITHHQACGAHPLNGLLKMAAQKALTINCIAQNNSGDTAGPKDRVVGYGAYALS